MNGAKYLRHREFIPKKAYLLEQCFRIHQLSMALHGCHGLHKPNSGSIERPDDQPSQSRRERGGTLPMLLSDRVAVFDMRNGGKQILSTPRAEDADWG